MSNSEWSLDQLREWVLEGRTNTWIGEQFGTSEASIRRARARHGLRISRPDGIAPVAGAKSPEWGFGKAKLVAPASTERWEIVVALQDIHFPYQDDLVLNAAARLIHSLQPHRVVVNGDVNDFFQLSRFNSGFERLDDLQDEIDQANTFRARLRDMVPNAVIDETEGNHDNRIRSYVARQGTALRSLRALRPETLFMYDDLGINWHPGCGFLLRPDFLVKHGTACSSTPGGTARAELQLNMISGMSGHVHRSEQSQKHGYRDLSWNVAGTMSRLDPDYITGCPNWNQGILVAEFSNQTGDFAVTNVPMVDGKLRFGCQSF